MKKYTNEVVIEASREKIIELFENPDNLIKWQPGFISMKHISGASGEIGSKYEMKYKMGKRDIVMIETVIEKKFHELYTFTYEAKGVWNEVSNHFEIIDENTTKYWTENDFKMKGFMKLMAFFVPGVFKKQSQKYLDLFKEFVEMEVSAS